MVHATVDGAKISGMDRHSTTGRGRAQARWTRNQRWSSDGIVDQSAENLVFVWIIALLWNILTLLALIPHFGEGIHGHEKSRWLALVFPAIGLALLILAYRRTRRIRKFGTSVFHLQTLPATPGGNLAGIIHVARKFPTESGIQLNLTCINRYLSGFGRDARVVDRVVWNETQTIEDCPPSDDGTDIPVLFHLPPDAEPTSDLDFGDGIRWRLEASCKTAGVRYYSRFEVPVFVVDLSEITTSSRRGVGSSDDSKESFDPRSNLGERGIDYERIGGRLQICFSAARDKSSIIVTAVIGLALIAIAIGLVDWPGFRSNRIVTRTVPWTILCVAAALDFKAIWSWLVDEQITVRYGSLTVERRAPFFLQQRTFKIGDISDIFHGIESRSSITSWFRSLRKKNFHCLVFETRDGDLVRLATDIGQEDYAAWLEEEIRDTFGLSPRNESC
jgi:hypothetical protein